MVEAGGVNGGVPDSVFAEALEFAHAHAVQLIAPQLELAKKVARPKVRPDVDANPRSPSVQTSAVHRRD